MTRPLTEKQVELLKGLNGPEGRLKFPQTIHEKKAFEKAEDLDFVESDHRERFASVQADGRVLRRFERAYRLTLTGMYFLEGR